MVHFIKKKKTENKKVAVLATGDPGMFGILSYLREHFSAEELNVIPGVSTAQYAFARLAMPWQDAVVVSTHGRKRTDFIKAVQSSNKVVALPGPGEPPCELARALKEAGIRNKKIYICSELTYPDEQVMSFTLEGLAGCGQYWDKKNYVMVIVDD